MPDLICSAHITLKRFGDTRSALWNDICLWYIGLNLGVERPWGHRIKYETEDYFRQHIQSKLPIVSHMNFVSYDVLCLDFFSSHLCIIQFVLLHSDTRLVRRREYVMKYLKAEGFYNPEKRQVQKLWIQPVITRLEIKFHLNYADINCLKRKSNYLICCWENEV